MRPIHEAQFLLDEAIHRIRRANRIAAIDGDESMCRATYEALRLLCDAGEAVENPDAATVRERAREEGRRAGIDEAAAVADAMRADFRAASTAAENTAAERHLAANVAEVARRIATLIRASATKEPA